MLSICAKESTFAKWAVRELKTTFFFVYFSFAQHLHGFFILMSTVLVPGDTG